jgi:UDP-galactose transporter B1
MRHDLSALANIVFCAVGIWVSFFYWGILQEKLSTKTYFIDGQQKRFKSFWILNGTQGLCASLVALVAMIFNSWTAPASHKRPLRIFSMPWSSLVLVGWAVLVGPQFGYASMQHLSFPVVLTVKMCKLIPILLVGIFWHGQKYPLSKVLNVVCITAGVVGMVLLAEEKHDSDKVSSWLGVILCLINVVIDGYSNSTQDAIEKKHALGGFGIMFGTNAAVVGCTLLVLVTLELATPYAKPLLAGTPLAGYFRSEVSDAYAFLSASPEALSDLFAMGLSNAIGQIFIFRALSRFGSLTATALTLTRKVGSVFISIYAHDHQFVPGQWVSLILVVVGVIGDTWLNIRGKPKSADAATKHKHH